MDNFIFDELDYSNPEEIKFVATLHQQQPLDWIDGYQVHDAKIEQTVMEMSAAKTDKSTCVITARTNKNIIVGFHWIRLKEEETTGRIHSLWVDEKYRRQGIASQLKKLGEEWFRARGATRISTEVFYVNKKMIDLNIKAGFTPWQVEMTKELRSDKNSLSFPSLETERLRLREPLPSDAAAIFEFRSDARVQQYNADPISSLPDAEALIERTRTMFQWQTGIPWVVELKQETKVIGLVGFSEWSRKTGHANIGYDFAFEYWGKGLASEAVRAIIKYGFSVIALQRIEAETSKENLPSIKLLKKLGFEHGGISFDLTPKNTLLANNNEIYALEKEKWESTQT
jgi:ribosomal-protein-alanine N-acetyltransferase